MVRIVGHLLHIRYLVRHRGEGVHTYICRNARETSACCMSVKLISIHILPVRAKALIAAGEDPGTSLPVKNAVAFLLRHQLANGGWGESYVSCRDYVYSADERSGQGGSNVVQTAWALLGLIAGGCEDKGVYSIRQ